MTEKYEDLVERVKRDRDMGPLTCGPVSGTWSSPRGSKRYREKWRQSNEALHQTSLP